MLQRLFDHFSDRLYPYFWRFRHLWSKGWPESYLYEESLNGKHRKQIMEAVKEFEPFETILDYGCGPGANIHLLANRYPEAKIAGVDISRKAIEWAKLSMYQFKNVRVWDLGNGDFERCAPWDVVLTDAVFIYCKNLDCKIEELKKQMMKGYVGCEWHSDDIDKPLCYGRHWVHNYRKLFPGCEVKKVEWDVPDDGWDTYGHIITWRK